MITFIKENEREEGLNDKIVTKLSTFLQCHFTEAFLEDLLVKEIVCIKNYLTDTIDMHIEGFVYAEQVDKKSFWMEFEVPKTWFQHFKMNVFPEWLKQIFPVEFKSIKREVLIEEYITYPEIKDIRWGQPVKRKVVSFGDIK